jgi:hypothetical protein
MRALLLTSVVLLALPGLASTQDKAKCSAALSNLKGAGAGPQFAEKRAQFLKACSALFSDPVIREFMRERLGQTSPFDHARLMLSVSTGEGERESYCATTRSTDLPGCADGAQLDAAEANRQWKVLLGRILARELGAKPGAELMKDFENAWTGAFPLKA